jgi:hypothetical protein
MSVWFCDECRRKFSGPDKLSPTGRRLCPTCSETYMAGALGVMTGGDNPVPAAISIRGWLRRVRRSMGKREP